MNMMSSSLPVEFSVDGKTKWLNSSEADEVNGERVSCVAVVEGELHVCVVLTSLISTIPSSLLLCSLLLSVLVFFFFRGLLILVLMLSLSLLLFASFLLLLLFF